MTAVRNYALVTGAYWAFTLTDGALRMLVLLHFHALGYGPVELSFLFLFYEFFGIVTNLFGGYLAARAGLRVTLLGGLALQVVALVGLSAVSAEWPKATSVAYVMGAQALSGIAKDLTKMSSKSAIKTLVPEGAESSLFKWVAILTGSKNALKGAGFFLGGALLASLGFRASLWAMAGALAVILLGGMASLPREMGKSKAKNKLATLLSKDAGINRLSAARFFLFGARDIWFVVAVPVFLSSALGWGFAEVGGFLALWVVGYGVVQSIAPAVIGVWTGGKAPGAGAARVLAFLLAGVMATLPVALSAHLGVRVVVLLGLGLFGVVFALNSSVHSYLVLAYSDGDKVALNVGFYYMANAGGRLVGTLLSGLVYGAAGLPGCLWTSFAFAAMTGVVSLFLPQPRAGLRLSEVKAEAGSD
jgi:predicted MFS family arabinose efflux permease